MATIVFKMMLTLFILCAAGFISRKTGLIDNTFSKKLSTLIIHVGQPFLIIASILGAEYSKEKLVTGFKIIGIGLLVHSLLAIAGALYTKHIKNVNEAKMTAYTIVFANCGFLGLPVVGAMLGADGLFCGAFYQIAFNLFLWSYGMILLGHGRDDIKLSPKKMILNYGTTPCIIGIVLYMLKPYFALPEFISSSFDYLGSLCTPISQLIVGGLIATRSLGSMFTSAKLYVFSAVKLILLPLISLTACKLLGVGEFLTYFITIMTALPCATNSTMFGEIYDIEPEYAAQLVGITSILSVVTIPLVMMAAGYIIKL